jgi:hypothetical protein
LRAQVACQESEPKKRFERFHVSCETGLNPFFATQAILNLSFAGAFAGREVSAVCKACLIKGSPGEAG